MKTTEGEHRDGSRVLRVSQYVKVRGERGLFRIMAFDFEDGTFDCYGGPKGYGSWRTFRLERIGARPVEVNRRARVTA